MEEMTNEQKKLFKQFIQICKDEHQAKTLENLLTSLKNNEIKNSLSEIQEIHKAYKGARENDSIQEIRKDIDLSQQHINEVYYKIFNLEDEEEMKSQMLINIEDAHQKSQELTKIYHDFYGEQNDGIIKQLETACQNIKDNQDKINKFEEFYTKVFVGIEADENENEKPSLERFLENKKHSMEELIKEHEGKFNGLYAKIENLLPGAASAGLADAYKREKEENKKGVLVWNWIFVGAILSFGALFFLYFYFFFRDDFTYMSILRILPLWIFSGFFIFYSTKQIAEYKRMAGEYAHKQRLNQTYMGYKKETEASNQALKEKLIGIMLDSAKSNPSKILNPKGETPNLNILQKTINSSNKGLQDISK